MPLDGQVNCSIKERMTWAHKSGKWLSLRCDEVLVEDSALVTSQHRFSHSRHAFPVSYRGWNVGDLVTAWLAPADGPAESIESFEKEGFYVVRLEAAGFGTFHVLTNGLNTAYVHRLVGQSPLLDEFLQLLTIHSAGHDSRKTGTNLGPFAVANRFDQEFSQRFPLELQFPEDVEDLSAQGFSCFLDLVEERSVNIALAGLVGYEVPQVADFRLANPVDAAKALFQAVRIPGKVVVHHEVSALKVDTFPCGVRCYENQNFWIKLECLLRVQALFPAHATVDDVNGGRTPKNGPNAVLEAGQSVTMFREDYELGRPLSRSSRATLSPLTRAAGRRKDLHEKVGEFSPLSVFATAANGVRQGLEALERLDFRFQLRNRPRRGGLIEDLFFYGLDLVVWSLFQIFNVVVLEDRCSLEDRRCDCPALKDLEFPESFLEPLPSPPQ